MRSEFSIDVVRKSSALSEKVITVLDDFDADLPDFRVRYLALLSMITGAAQFAGISEEQVHEDVKFCFGRMEGG